MCQEFLTCGYLLPLVATGCKEGSPELTSVRPGVTSGKVLGCRGKDLVWDMLI